MLCKLFFITKLDVSSRNRRYIEPNLSTLLFLPSAMDEPSMHLAMFPWFAMGHLTPYLHLANALAKRGHKISFFTPKRTQSKLEHFNLNPHLITFIPINVPHVEGLPDGAETTADVPFSLYPLIATAMDQTKKDIEILLLDLKPNIVLFDFSFWLPDLTRSLGIKSVQYWISNPATMAYLGTPYRWQQEEQKQGGNFRNFYIRSKYLISIYFTNLRDLQRYMISLNSDCTKEKTKKMNLY